MFGKKKKDNMIGKNVEVVKGENTGKSGQVVAYTTCPETERKMLVVETELGRRIAAFPEECKVL